MDLVKQFEGVIANSIDEYGVNPQYGIVVIDDKIEMSALALHPKQIYQWFWDQVACKTANSVIFGLDRFTKPGQGTEFNDAITVCHWEDGMNGKSWDSSFRIGVINYQHDPRIVRRIDWGNEFWIKLMTGELGRTRTYDRRIKVTKSEAVK